MKRILLLLLTVLMVNTLSYAQESTDTTKFKLGDVQFLIIDEAGQKDTANKSEMKVKDYHFNAWSGIDLGVNGLLTADGSTSLPKDLSYMELDYARSLVWNFNIVDVNWDWVDLEDDTRFKKVSVGFISGIGLTYRSYSFENNSLLINAKDSTFGIEDTLLSYDKNKLRSSYLRVPMMLQFYTRHRKGDHIKTGFHIAAGVVGGLRLGSVYKRKYEFEGNRDKIKRRDDFNLSSLTLDAEVRIGYGHLSFFANYGLTPFFEKDKGPELYAAAVGLSLTRLF